ncbi:MAG: hypothetical protein Q7R81_01090 [Candidatus Peregrinibacteria bacterium]|nr:hypothetical protein [Candidatus Peregrinibacteria bacterium]
MVHSLTILFLFFVVFPVLPTSAEGIPTLTVSVEERAPSMVARGAQRVPAIILTLTASCDAPVTVTTLHVSHGGQGAIADIMSVAAYRQGVRLSASRPLDAEDGDVQLALKSLVIPPCGREEVMVGVSISPDAVSAGEHRFILDPDDGVTAPGALVEIGTTIPSQTSVAPVAEGVVSVEYLRLLHPVRYGKEQGVARIKISADVIEDQALQTITFTNVGSARDGHLQKLTLRTGRGQVLAGPVATLDGKKVTFRLAEPLLIEKGENRVLTVTADVLASAKRTIRLVVEEREDILAVPVRGRLRGAARNL